MKRFLVEARGANPALAIVWQTWEDKFFLEEEMPFPGIEWSETLLNNLEIMINKTKRVFKLSSK